MLNNLCLQSCKQANWKDDGKGTLGVNVEDNGCCLGQRNKHGVVQLDASHVRSLGSSLPDKKSSKWLNGNCQSSALTFGNLAASRVGNFRMEHNLQE